MVQTSMSDVACSRVSDHSWSRGSRGVDFAFRGIPLWAQTRPDRPISDDFSLGLCVIAIQILTTLFLSDASLFQRT